MLSRFFPGARDELAAIDDELAFALLGPALSGKASCFEEQYASTGGQLYELMIGHDRFNADLRPLMAPVLAARGLPRGLCCHPSRQPSVLGSDRPEHSLFRRSAQPGAPVFHRS